MDAKLIRAQLAALVPAEVSAWGGLRLIWGTHDCALAAANILRGPLGVDPAAAWRGRYRTARGARRVLGAKGLPGALAATARRLRWPSIAPAKARTGDIGLIRTKDGHAVVIFDRAHFVGPVDGGYSVTPADLVLKAWKVA